MRIRFIAAVLAVLTVVTNRASAQSGPEAGTIWKAVEARWKAWESGDLKKMLDSYHPSFHTWNPVTGRVDDINALTPAWNKLLEVERVDSVKLEPVQIIINGDVASAYYVSREKVARISRDSSGKKSFDSPIVLSSLWTEYLAKSNGRWLTIGHSSVECTESEPEGSACRRK